MYWEYHMLRSRFYVPSSRRSIPILTMNLRSLVVSLESFYCLPASSDIAPNPSLFHRSSCQALAAVRLLSAVEEHRALGLKTSIHERLSGRHRSDGRRACSSPVSTWF
ncbi:hypothetical protein MPH_05336 [Macrophomina phaseolina MS6]|uniref:Uncharacterized protein n=1 Tax=Macrophomina phaseolina (strain MS6) TaxID=1126212 RepID=K2SKT9_MACPH|nr:hypothetical protein MPH_05336 [Macrophomina phaseolina MS6]